MSYLDINLRLKQIKNEIFELGNTPDANLISKINALKMINRLLKEQNSLLGIKHKHIYSSSAA